MKRMPFGMALAVAGFSIAIMAPVTAEPIVTDRPDFTESAETVPQGMHQLEGGYTFTRMEDDKEHSFGELLLRSAVGPRTEVRVGINSYLQTRTPSGNTSGWEDPSLGFKVKLADAAPGFGLRQPNVALIVATTLPIGSSAYREDKWQPEAKLCFGWDLSERVALSSNLNYGYASEGGQRYDQFSGSVSVGFGLTDRTSAYAEFFGFSPSGKGGPDTGYLSGGMTYLINDDYQLDVRVGVGVNGISNDHFAGIGASRRW